MSETTTYCVGRYLIDLPKDNVINGQRGKYMFSYIEVDKADIDAKGFVAKMKNREAELKAGKHKSEFNLTETLSPSADIRIFKLSRPQIFRHKDPPSVGLEAYRLNNGTIFSMGETGFNQKFPQIVERLQSQVLPGIRTRQIDDVPTDPGFCFKDGFIADDGSQEQYEDSAMSFKFNQWPDLTITFSTNTVNEKGKETLFQRLDKHPIPAMFASIIANVKILRKGVHEVDGRKGEEVLQIIPTEHGIKQHSFRWEAAGEVGKPLFPRLVVRYESGAKNGNPVPTTLTNDQAIQLFDSIVNSIRLRPTGPAKVSVAVPPPLPPLGTALATGEICPQSGWWHCDEAIRYSYIQIEGGRQQFFDAGQVMPQAILVGKPTFWQKLFDGKEAFRHPTKTVWKLAAYDDTTLKSLAATGTDPDKTNQV